MCEDRNLVQVLLTARYFGNSEILQRGVLLDPQILDVNVLDLACACARADAFGASRIRVTV